MTDRLVTTEEAQGTIDWLEAKRGWVGFDRDRYDLARTVVAQAEQIERLQGFAQSVLEQTLSNWEQGVESGEIKVSDIPRGASDYD